MDKDEGSTTGQLNRSHITINPPLRQPKEIRVLVTGHVEEHASRLAELEKHQKIEYITRPSIPSSLRELVDAAHRARPFTAVLFVGIPYSEDYQWLKKAVQQRSPIAHTHICQVQWEEGIDDPDGNCVAFEQIEAKLSQSPGSQSARKTLSEGSSKSLGSYGLNVLVVEDDHFSQIVCRSLLKKFGCMATVAGSGDEAIKLHRERFFDLILMDIRLPGINGHQATLTIREQEQKTGRHTPVIALTANVLREDREACERSGMDDFIGKPVTANALQRVLERCKRSHQPPAVTPDILLIEENNCRRREMLEQIRQLNPHINVHAASDGISGCKAIFLSQPEIVILDTAIRGIDASALLRHFQLYRNDYLRVPQFIALTVLDSDNPRVRELTRWGAAKVLPSPPDTNTLIEAIQEVMQGAQSSGLNLQESLDNVTDSEEALRKLFVERLKKSLPPEIDSLRTALREGNTETALNLAHRLKSTAGYIGHKPFTDLAHEIETVCRKEELEVETGEAFEQKICERSAELLKLLETP